MNEEKQKFLSTLIVSIGAFLGFEALSLTAGLYQVKNYVVLSIYIYLFHVFWLTFIFDLHFKKVSIIGAYLSGELESHLVWQAIKDRVSQMLMWSNFRHYQNYLVLPGIIYWTTVCLLFLNPFKELIKQVIVIGSSLAMVVAYWYFKDFFSKKLEVHEVGLHILSLVKLYAAFLVSASSLGISWYFGMGPEFLVMAVFALTFFLLYQALFHHKLLNFQVYLSLVIISSLVAVVAYLVFIYWGSGYLTGALVVLAVYNVCWGVLHHYLDNNLTKKIAIEYVLMTMVVLSLLLGGHDFMPRIH